MMARALRWCGLAAVVMASLLTVGEVGYCVSVRLLYPFELTKMEGVIVDHARRVAAGQPIYGPPSAEFVPLLYFPLSYYPAGWLIRAGVDGFLASRLVSLGSILAAGLVGMWLVKRITGNRWLALLVPVLIASTYFDTRCFYDQARSDNLMSLSYLLAVASLTLRSPSRAVLLFTVFAAATFFTKQSALVLLGALLAGTLFVRPWVAVAAAAGLALFGGAGVYAFDRATDGWLYLYCFHAPSFHGLGHRALVDAFGDDFVGAFTLFTATAMGAAVLLLASPAGRRSGPLDEPEATWRVLVIGTVAAGLFAAASIWQQEAVKNVYVVYAVMGAVLLPAAAGRVYAWLNATSARVAALPLVLVVLALAAGRGVRDPEPFLPRPSDAEVWREFRDQLSTYGPPETIWVTLHGSALGAGLSDPMRPHMASIRDYVGGYFGDETGHELPGDLLELISERYFRAIVVAEWDKWTQDLIRDTYRPDFEAVPFRLPAFYGVPPALQVIWIPRDAASAGAGHE